MDNFLTEAQRRELILIARQALSQHVKEKTLYLPQTEDVVLKKERGIFVTLHKGLDLRGCIGTIIARAPLYLEVRDLVISASSRDPRFSPVGEAELKDIRIEISVLSDLRKIKSPEEIILGKHGVLVRKGFRSGVFLPQVASDTGWSKDEFMDNLCIHKAGLSQDSWRKGKCDIYIFSAEVFSE